MSSRTKIFAGIIALLFIFFVVKRVVTQQDYLTTSEIAPQQDQAEEAPEDTVESELSLIEEEMVDLEMEDGYYRIDWKFLSKIDFEERYNEEVEDYIYYPIFHPSVKRLEGQPVVIKGYVIPFEETGSEDLIILSAFPFSNCFFCGNAGPESVMDIQLNTPLRERAEMDDEMEFRGKLHLNDTDLYYLNYMLMEAEGLDE